ncbi:response regulator [Salmonella enterica]|nr:response regulator [Salmonella enterica]
MKKNIIDNKIVLDVERITLSSGDETIKISESECNLLLCFYQGLFKKDDLISNIWGRKGVVVSNASYYKLVNQLRGSFETIGLPSSTIVTRPKVGVTLSVTIEAVKNNQVESTPEIEKYLLPSPKYEHQITTGDTGQGQSLHKGWLLFCCSILIFLGTMYYFHKGKSEFFTILGNYNGYDFYGVTGDKLTLRDAISAYDELNSNVFKQNGKFIYYIRIPDTNIFVQCLNKINVAEPKCITIKQRF